MRSHELILKMQPLAGPDWDTLWRINERFFREGSTCPFARKITKEEAYYSTWISTLEHYGPEVLKAGVSCDRQRGQSELLVAETSCQHIVSKSGRRNDANAVPQ